MDTYDIGIISMFIILSGVVCLEIGHCLFQAAKNFINDDATEGIEMFFFEDVLDQEEWPSIFLFLIAGEIGAAALSIIWPLSTLAILVFLFLWGTRWITRINKKLKKVMGESEDGKT